MKNDKTKIVAVVGPTASGKSALAVALAEETAGEIISCDSMQIYRGMDIGTAKPTREEQERVRYHLIDIRDAREDFSCAEYVTLAKETICEVSARGKLPILCGGTGLYLDGVLYGGSFEDTPNDPAVRARLAAEAETLGAEAMYAKLKAIDPESAAATHPNNIKRVLRALEIYACCGKTKSELDRASRTKGMLYDATVIGLRAHNREVLYRRIDERVDDMIREGLPAEVRQLSVAGVFDSNPTAAQAIGYKELLGVLHGDLALSDAVEALKLATRHYAKRQLTWFGAKSYVRWLYIDTEDGCPRPFADICADARALLKEF